MSPRRAAALRDSADRDLREHLITTAERLLGEPGGADLTVRAIARAAGVADGVLYNHFSDKEELLAAALRAHLDAAHRQLPTLPAVGSATVAENLAIYLRAGLAMHRTVLPVLVGLAGRPRVLEQLAESQGHERDWRDRLTDYVLGEQAAGRLNQAADPAAAVAILVGICHDEVLAAVLPAAPRRAAPSVVAVVDTVLAGIGGC